jgi:hypothetical protein
MINSAKQSSDTHAGWIASSLTLLVMTTIQIIPHSIALAGRLLPYDMNRSIFCNCAKTPFAVIGPGSRCADAAHRLKIAARNRASRSSRSSSGGGLARASAVMRWEQFVHGTDGGTVRGIAPRAFQRLVQGVSPASPRIVCPTLSCCSLSGKSPWKPAPQAEFQAQTCLKKGLSQKPEKMPRGPFQSRRALVHTPRTQGLARVAFSGSLRTGLIGALGRWPKVIRVRLLKACTRLSRGGAAR